MPAMLLSIKPEYAQRIIDGTKGFEFRTRRCRKDINKIIFYSTAPESKVVGEAEIEEIISGAPSTVWELTKHAAGIPRKFFRKYYKGRRLAVAYKLKNVIAYDEPKSLEDYDINHVGSTKKWERIESYEQKFVEIIVQAVSRDILCYAMKTLRHCFIVGHVHDELIIECSPGVDLKAVCEQMGRSPDWMPDILLRADGYETDWYRKD